MKYCRTYIVHTCVKRIITLFFGVTDPYWGMVLILHGNSMGNSLKGAHVRRNICYSTCSRHLITSRSFYPKRDIFLHACATCNELPSNISTMGLGCVEFIAYYSGIECRIEFFKYRMLGSKKYSCI